MSDTRLFILYYCKSGGIRYSAIYPLLVSTGSAIYEKELGILSSMIFAVGYGGKTTTPFITKAIAEKTGIPDTYCNNLFKRCSLAYYIPDSI